MKRKIFKNILNRNYEKKCYYIYFLNKKKTKTKALENNCENCYRTF